MAWNFHKSGFFDFFSDFAGIPLVSAIFTTNSTSIGQILINNDEIHRSKTIHASCGDILVKGESIIVFDCLTLLASYNMWFNGKLFVCYLGKV